MSPNGKEKLEFTSADKRSLRIAFFVFFETPAILFWCYIITKLFVFDVDIALLRAISPEHLWILDFKFFAFLGVVALIAALAPWQVSLAFFALTLFYPLFLVFWRVPRFIYGRGSWALAFASFNFVISFFRSFKRNIILAAIIAISIAIALTASNRYVLATAALTLFGTLTSVYIVVLMSAFRPPRVFGLYRRALPPIRKFVLSNGKLDATTRLIPTDTRNTAQLQAWANKVQIPLLANRIWLFLALRFREYQKSAAPFISSILILVSIFALTTVCFAAINFAIAKIDATSYDGSNSSFFTFLWYSFNAILFNFVKELAPQAPLSQAIWMTEAFFALFLIAIVIGLFFSVRSQRSAHEIDEVISDMESEGREMEIFVRSEYELATIEDAIAEMERQKLGLFKLLLWFTKNTLRN